LDGLSASPKSIPAKYFYDQRGSELFEAICDLPEYYPTRTEMTLMTDHAGEIGHLVGPGVHLIEFGSGSSTKVRLLLSALQSPASYVAIDIAGPHLFNACRALAVDYAALQVTAICADFTQPVDLSALPAIGRRVGFFPGSTIGNLSPQEAEGFLSQIAAAVRHGGGSSIAAA